MPRLMASRSVTSPVHTLRNWLGVELVEVSIQDKMVAILGGGISIFLLMLLSTWAVPDLGATRVVASMGASAVLLFAVPHGPLSQPWPVIVGHGVSAVIGVACAYLVPVPMLAAACAVGLAIGAMVQLKCIHPPGGATAFTAAVGCGAIHQLGFRFVLFPVLANAVILVLLAVLMNTAFRWRRYPAAWGKSPSTAPPASGSDADSLPTPTHEEFVAAVRSLDSFVDVQKLRDKRFE